MAGYGVGAHGACSQRGALGLAHRCRRRSSGRDRSRVDHWGIGQRHQVDSIVAADRYTQLLHILGGKEFRAGTLIAAPGLSVQGSAVVYDSHEGQSWAAVFVRGPDLHGPATATLHSGDGRAVDLYVHFQRDGSGSAWLVTAMDLQDFDQMTITGADGHVIATAPLRPA